MSLVSETNEFLHLGESLPAHFVCNNKRKSRYSLSVDRYYLPKNVFPIAEEKSPIVKSLNGHQILILSLLAYGNFWVAACVSLQAPFFPQEAELKGATPTQYGLVFGIYELMIAVTSPLFGKLVALTSPVFLCEVGLFVSGSSTILFGVLDRAPDGTTFIVLCFVVRVFEGIASAAFMTSSYAIMTKQFPDKIVTTFSLLQTSFGLGLILGPTLGGTFYQLGGFITPFATLGSFLMLGGVFTYILMPITYEPKVKKSGNMLNFISDFGVLLDALAIATSLNFIGFNAATLEPHLRQFNLQPYILGFIFVIFGLTHAIITPIWGKLCDKGFDPRKLCTFGSILCIIGFLLIGPQQFIDIETQLWLTITSLILIGSGMASKLVTAFISAMNDSLNRRGLPNDITTYGLVSAMYFSANSIGAFIGPTLGGFLLEETGYRKSTFFIFIIEIVLVLLNIMYLMFRRNCKTEEESKLLKPGPQV